MIARTALITIATILSMTAPTRATDLNTAAAMDTIASRLRLTKDQRATAPAIFELEARKAAEKQKVDDSTNRFKGFGPGIGTGISFYAGDNKPIRSAAVVDGTVRVTEETGVSASFMFETHFFFTSARDSTWGYGPFVGVLSSSDDVIDAFSLGAMVGKRRSTKDSASFNVGLGFVVNPKSQVLGDGLEANKELPTGETEVRFKTKSVWGFQLMTTFQF
jgi:hypothetical protein